MEFHLLNEREIKTIRPRTSARSCLQARSRARVRPPRHSLIFTLGILDPETTFDSSVGFNFFRAALFIPPIPHLSLSPRRSFIAASFTVRLPLTILAAPSSLSPSEREREREREGEPSFLSLSLPHAACASIRALSFRVVAILRPSSILRPRTPLLFPPLFSLPTSRQRAPRARHCVLPFVFIISEISLVSESPPFVPSDSPKSLPFAN